MQNVALSRNSIWHGLKNGEMPPFPEPIVKKMLLRFGIEDVEDLQPWPFGPFDILAQFSVNDRAYVLKGRHVEQRGERSLCETQYIQKELLKLRVPVAPFWSAPNGETLLKGSDWKEDGELYYEIQAVLPGEFFVLNKNTARQAGACIAQFHQAGQEIDTFLLNKMFWIKDFTTRRYDRFKRLREQISTYLSGDEIRLADAMFERLTNAAWRDSLTWRLIHGDMSSNNLLIGDRPWIVDLDEVGLGEVVDDLGHFLREVPRHDPGIIEDVLRGYLDAGGDLNEADLQEISDGFVVGGLEDCVGKADGQVLELFDDQFCIQFIK